ncbi:MAG: protein-methionine-sulfoxide reductase catalytic subunit MsrP [Pseudomonadales bacterium]
MLIRKPADIPPSEITPERWFHARRRVVQALGLGAGIGLAPVPSAAFAFDVPEVDEPVTPEQIVTTFNNFYEFGTDKGDPARYAHRLTTSPWRVKVSGEAEVTGEFDYEDLIKGFTPEERIYRHRCVEAWSIVVPWQGIPLEKILTRLKPTAQAKFVEFTTLYRPDEMPGQRAVFSSIDWPYVEGLRMDEATHPLTIMVTGVYGKDLPNQNGAPWRLVVPWKYGFKSIKSIVGIRFTRRQPKNSWQIANPREYGFYANVNPEVSHPRWSQARERRLPSTLLDPNWRPTLPFNGYAEEVAHLYDGMDLKRYF